MAVRTLSVRTDEWNRGVESMIARRIPDWIRSTAVAAILIGWSSAAVAAMEPPENAALIYDDIALRLYGDPTDRNRVRLLDPDAETRIADLLEGGPVTAEVRADMARVREVLELANRAASLAQHDRDLDRAAGFAMLLPHLSSMRQTARLMMADATIRFADGDTIGAAETLGSSLALASHVSTDRLLVSTLVSAAIAGLGSQHLQRAIDHGRIDADEATLILSRAERLDPTDPFGFADALEGELELLRTSVHGVLDADPRLDEVLDAGFFDDANPFTDMPAEEALAQLAEAESLYAEVAEAIHDPDPEMAKQRLAAIEARIEAGEGGVLVATLAPAFSRIFDAKLRAEANLNEPLAQLREIAAGTKTASDFTNAAIWLRQAAQAASRLDADEQRLIEAIRVAPDAFEGDENEVLRDELKTILDRHRDAITTPLLAASKAGRCRFDDDPFRRRNIAVADHLVGIRAAVRFQIVDAIFEPPQSPNQAPATQTPPSESSRIDAAGTRTTGDAPTGRDPRGRDPRGGDPRGEEPVGDDPRGEGDESPDDTAPSSTIAQVAPIVRIIELVGDDPRLAHSMLATAMLDDLVASLPKILARASPRTPQDAEAIVAMGDAVAKMDRADPLGHRRGLDRDRQLLVRHFTADYATRARRVALVEQLDANQVFAVALALQAFTETEIRPTAAEIIAAQAERRSLDLRPRHDLDAPASEHPPCMHFDRGPLLSFRDLVDADACATIFARRVDIGADAPVLRATRDAPPNVRDPLGGVAVPTVVDMSRLAHRAISLLDELDQMIRRAARSQSSP